MAPDVALAALRSEAAAFRAAASQAEPDAPVPSCPGWTVRDLIGHTGAGFGWIAGHVRRGVTSEPEPRIPVIPDHVDLSWWDGQLAAMIGVLQAVDPDLPAWNWAPRPKTASFWHRLEAHEVAMHRWDAQFAVVSAEPIEMQQAVDGVSEVLDTWLPAGARRGPTDVAGKVALYAVDADEQWHLRLRPGGGFALLDTDTLLDSDDGHERAVAQGTASDLMLALWDRVDVDVLDITGDQRLLEALRTG